MRIRVSDDIVLDEFSWEDVDALVKGLNDPVIYNNTLTVPFPYTEDNAREWINVALEARIRQKSPAELAIRHDEYGLIGGLSLIKRNEKYYSHQVEIGYWLANAYRGNGYMSIILETFSNWIFENLAYEKITAMVYNENIGSIYLLEKCGYKQEGLLKKHLLKDGKYRDCRLYARFRD
jgi:RimJ/RimL family protein N-acetyltransferase